jgi:hypothetical protein
MSKYDDLKFEILKRAKNAGSQFAAIQTFTMAEKYKIADQYVRETLIELHSEKYIQLSAWDGQQDKPFDQWQSANYFFNFGSDSLNRRVRLLARGDEFLENLTQSISPARSPIGFTA